MGSRTPQCVLQIGKALGLLALAALYACGGSEPEEAVLGFLESVRDGRYEDAYALVSSKDQEIRSFEEFVGEAQETGPARAVAQRASYRLDTVRVTGDTADVWVEVTLPDLSGMVMGLLGAAFLEDTAGIRRAAEEQLEGADTLPTITQRVDFTALREQGEWRIYLNWEGEELETAAEQALERGDLEAAADAYRAALELDPESEELQDALSDAEQGVQLQNAIAEYREASLRLENVGVIRRSRYGIGEPEPAIRGRVVNAGDSTLSKVQVVAYFLNNDGRVIGEMDFHPILVTEFSFGDDTPLRPGYEEDFGFWVADEAPANWGGEVRLELGEIEFADPGQGR